MLHYPALGTGQRVRLQGPTDAKRRRPACQRERGQLAEALKALRAGAGPSGARLAEVPGGSRESFMAARSAPERPRRRWLAAARRCRRVGGARRDIKTVVITGGLFGHTASS